MLKWIAVVILVLIEIPSIVVIYRELIRRKR